MALASHPAQPSLVYAASGSATVFKSSDAGRRWELAATLGRAADGDLFVDGPRLHAFAIDRADPATLYAALGYDLHRSVDGGESWEAAGPTLDSRFVHQLVSLDDSASVLMALVDRQSDNLDSRLQRSTDRGTTWSWVVLPEHGEPPARYEALSLVTSSADPAKVIAPTLGGTLVSSDSGATWAPLSTPTPRGSAIAVATSAPSTLFFVDGEHRVYRSTDSGEHWVERGAWIEGNPFRPDRVQQLLVDAQDPSTLYLLATLRVGSVGGFQSSWIQVSSDAGLTWRMIADPEARALRATLLASVASSPSTLLVAGDETGIAVSGDQAHSFEPSRGLQATSIQALALPPRPPTVLYAGALSATVYTSFDQGASWSDFAFFPPPEFGVVLFDLEADSQVPTTLWAATSISLHKSLDAGRTFATLGDEGGLLDGYTLALAPSSSSFVYTGGSTDLGGCNFRSSADGGATWSCEDTAPLVGGGRVLAVDPADPRRVHVGDHGERLSRTLDAGKTWQVVADPLDVTALAVDPLDPTAVYAGTSDRGIWKSADRGSSWSPLAAAGLPDAGVAELALHPLDPDVLYASSVGTGVFESRDGGATFAPLDAGLPASTVAGPLAIDARLPSVLYAGTRGAGLYRIQRESPAPCVENERTLCLGNGRFQAQARWRDFRGRTGPGRAVRLTDDSGYFWFFEEDNLELVVKALDGRTLNDRFWVFYGALTNVEFQLVVTDTVTGEVNAYFNPERQFASRGDTLAFPRDAAEAVRSAAALSAAPLQAGSAPDSPTTSESASGPTDAPSCEPDALTLCLGEGRFRITVEWSDFRGRTGTGQAQPLNQTTGCFWFFDQDNLEIAIKVLDGRALNGRFWVFYGALSNVEYRIRVEDTATGEVRSYFNPLHQFASRGDTAAFPVS